MTATRTLGDESGPGGSIVSAATAPWEGPLSGVKVVGLEHSVAGPLCSRLLADMGATVLKVERSPEGDFSRQWDDHMAGESAQFWWLNRDKQAITLDLKDPHSRELLFELIESADVLVQNMNPSAADRLGLNSESFDKRYPRLIHCQISGYGESGPLRSRKAYDLLVQAESGIMSLTGEPDRPIRVGVSICDVSAGLYAALLVLASLREREQSGRGRRLDVAMFDVAAEFVAPMLMSYLNREVVYKRHPNRHHAICPYGVFSCRDGEQIVLAIEQDGEWRNFCSVALGDHSIAADERFRTNLDRVRNRDALEPLVEAAMSKLTLVQAVELFEAHGFAYGMVNDMARLKVHPVLAHRSMTERVTTSGGETVTSFVSIAARMFETSGSKRNLPPSLGQDPRSGSSTERDVSHQPKLENWRHS